MPHQASKLVSKQNRELKRMHDAAVAALMVAAQDVVGDDQAMQIEKIAEWLKRAEQLAAEPESSAIQ